MGAIRSLVTAKCQLVECERVLDEGLLVPVPLYVSETDNDMKRKEDVYE